MDDDPQLQISQNWIIIIIIIIENIFIFLFFYIYMKVEKIGWL
jgi:hypothetical protein